jgi:hypothetical protein
LFFLRPEFQPRPWNNGMLIFNGNYYFCNILGF